MISYSKAVIIGFTLETLFYGVFLVVFGISTNLQWCRHRKAPLTFGNKLVFAFSVFLCLFITTHWVLNLWVLCDAFLQSPTPLAREIAFADLGATKNILKLTIYKAQTWMGDALLIYRLYHVTGRKWVVIVPPILTYCAVITCSCQFLYHASRLDLTQPQTLPAAFSLIRKWAIATFSLVIVENTYCLALTALFIWKIHRDIHRATSSSLQYVLRIFVESAGVWVFFIFLTFIIYLCNENASYVLLYPTNPILGISFCMMTIRLQLRRKATAVGSGNAKSSYLNDVKAPSGGPSSYTAGHMDVRNEIMVFSSKQTVDDSTFDTTTSKV